jgi:hypothetical protein
MRAFLFLPKKEETSWTISTKTNWQPRHYLSSVTKLSQKKQKANAVAGGHYQQPTSQAMGQEDSQTLNPQTLKSPNKKAHRVKEM